MAALRCEPEAEVEVVTPRHGMPQQEQEQEHGQERARDAADRWLLRMHGHCRAELERGDTII